MFPFVRQALAADAADIDQVVGAGDGIEAGGVDDNVELVVARRRAQALLGDAHQRRLADVDEMNVVAVIGFEIIRLQRQPLHTKAVIFRNQLLRDLRVLHPAADAVGDILGQLRVGRLVHKNLAEIGQPDAKPGLVIELVPQLQPLLARDLVEAALVRSVQETARRTGASSEDIVIARTDVGHLLIGDRAVVERRAPVRTALEHRELANLVGDLRDQLDSGGAGADHGDLLAFEIDRLVRPIKGVERASPKILYAFDPRHGRRRQQTDGEHDEAAGQLAAVADFHLPEIARLVELHGLDGAVELHVFAQIELVGDVVQIPQVLGLAGEALLPVPFVEQFLRERKAVGVALGIEAAAGIAVPVPGAADVFGFFQQHR
ncbi:hypothetical protein ES703_46308 [subsurface metagenome]